MPVVMRCHKWMYEDSCGYQRPLELEVIETLRLGGKLSITTFLMKGSYISGYQPTIDPCGSYFPSMPHFGIALYSPMLRSFFNSRYKAAVTHIFQHLLLLSAGKTKFRLRLEGSIVANFQLPGAALADAHGAEVQAVRRRQAEGVVDLGFFHQMPCSVHLKTQQVGEEKPTSWEGWVDNLATCDFLPPIIPVGEMVVAAVGDRY